MSMDVLNLEYLSSNLKSLIKEVACDFLNAKVDNTIALVLTGSFARGEGSYVPDGNGGIRLLGDIEFLLVSESKDEGNAFSREIERKLASRLEACGIKALVDVGYVRFNYFVHLKPHIFAVELKAHAKVLFGDKSILEMIPDLNVKDIPRWDALHLLFNRMVEQMMLLDGLLNGGADDICKAHYQNIKLTLDICGSLLVFQRNYHTTYLERSLVFEEALDGIDHPLIRESLSELPAQLKYWTSIKLNPISDEILVWDGDPSQIKDYRKAVLKRWLELVDLVRGLWTWEMNSYLKGEWVDDPEILLKRYLKRERLGSRARGWAKWVSRLRKSGAVPYVRLLRLFPLGSPRALIYASAALLYFSLPDVLEENEGSHWKMNTKKVGNLLPGFNEVDITDWASICSNVAGSWQEHVKNG